MNPPDAFYLPEDASFTIVDSALASVRFLRAVSERDADGHLWCRSIDATPDGALVRYRGRLMDGVGYCADSIYAAHVLVRAGRVLERPELEAMGFSYLDHALAAGFFDDPELPMRMYVDIESGRFLHNVEANDSYLELGHMARVATQLIAVAELDADPARAERCRAIATETARWVRGVQRCANGWYPRRIDLSGAPFPHRTSAFGPIDISSFERIDPVADRSGAGTLALQLLVAATEGGLLDARETIREDVDAFVAVGGCFGSTNTDTEDLDENVSYAFAFQTLLAASRVLDDEGLAEYAYERCLAPLEGFELLRDMNGLRTKGLLWMERSWNAACTWEMGEAAQAYLIAFADRGRTEHATKALTILRGLAMHHHGPLGFLTEAVDWDGHSTAERHFPGERYGDIVTTHPFLNNLHILLPTVTYLERHAHRLDDGTGQAYFDLEGNRLCPVPVPVQPWMVDDEAAAATDPAVEVARDALRHEAAMIQAVATRLGPAFSEVVQLIESCAGRIVVTGLGKSGLVGRKVAATLASTGTPAFFVHATEALHGDAGMLLPSDVLIAISYSGETEEVVRFARMARSRGAKVVVIAGDDASSLAREADGYLDTAVEREADPLDLAPTASTAVTMALGDALAIALMHLRGSQPEDFFANHPGGSLGRLAVDPGASAPRATSER